MQLKPKLMELGKFCKIKTDHGIAFGVCHIQLLEYRQLFIRALNIANPPLCDILR